MNLLIIFTILTISVIGYAFKPQLTIVFWLMASLGLVFLALDVLKWFFNIALI